MYKLTTFIYNIDKPNKNGRCYGSGCFDSIDSTIDYPVIFKGSELSFQNILCTARVNHYDDVLEVATEPLLKNDRYTHKAVLDAFNASQVILSPCGHGEVTYDAANDIYIISKYRLTHFEICSQINYPWKTTLEAL